MTPTDRENSGRRRIACILVADFPLAAVTRANPELRDQPLAFTRLPTPKPSTHNRGRSDYQPHSELSQVAAVARAMGVRAGMTVAQARALMPRLIVTQPSDAAEDAAADALTDAAESISPVVEAGTPGCVWLDLTGVARLHRNALGADRSGTDEPEMDAEQILANEIARRVRRIGLEAAVGIAANKELAQLAARCGGIRVIPPGREREFLDWLPLELADLGAGPRADDRELRFKRLGIRRLGDLARLDIRAIGNRMGEPGVRLARLARGEGSSTVRARPRPELFAEALELDYGIENLEPLGFVMHTMLDRIGARLALRGLVAGDLTLSLGLVDRRRDERRVAVAAPTGEVRALLMLLKLSLEQSPPAAPIETIRLTVEPRAPRPAQHDMFIPPAPAPDRLEAAIARIAALCGPDRVGTLLPADSYRPEAVRVAGFAPPTASVAAASRTTKVGGGIVRMALRTIRPAEEIEMMCQRETPEFARGQNICARVIAVAGPWRRQGEWWAAAEPADGAAQPKRNNPHAAAWQAGAPAAYARDYYELALEDGGVYRMYRDHHSGKWFVDGVYD
jgi:nucleotidyltransferase/DNA polymerase involved in DNA repair